MRPKPLSWRGCRASRYGVSAVPMTSPSAFSLKVRPWRSPLVRGRQLRSYSPSTRARYSLLRFFEHIPDAVEGPWFGLIVGPVSAWAISSGDDGSEDVRSQKCVSVFRIRHHERIRQTADLFHHIEGGGIEGRQGIKAMRFERRRLAPSIPRTDRQCARTVPCPF